MSQSEMKYQALNLCLSFLLFAVHILFTTSCSRVEPSVNASFPLKEYVMSGDELFDYTIVEEEEGESWKEYKIKMVSGSWLTEEDVDHTLWWHWLNIIIPDNAGETESMMIIAGGSSNDSLPLKSRDRLIQAALKTGSIISRVTIIPFQPLNFKGDERDERYEDAIITFGWKKYLESGAREEMAEWLAFFPMTRAVVRAMDVVQEVSRMEGKPVDHFFVTGASKRGWTTWLTGAVDDRVIGIAPTAIDLLNLVPSFRHHWRCYGEWSPSIHDYVEHGIMNWVDTDEFNSLIELISPYSFIDRLSMPKLLTNNASDEFFVTDSWRFYWDDLKGEKYLHYIPNAGHGSRGSYKPSSLVPFYHYVITEKDLPDFSWKISGDTIYMDIDPGADYQIRKWEAVNEKGRDFRTYVIGETWWMEEIGIEDNGKYAISVSQPERGYKAALAEVVFNPGSDFKLTFTSGTLVTPDTYPFPPFVPNRD